MSVKISTRVWREYDGPPRLKLTLLALADYADDEGVCWPSYATVGRKVYGRATAEAARRLARRAVADLVSEGALEIVSRGGPKRCERQPHKTNRYRVLPPAWRPTSDLSAPTTSDPSVPTSSDLSAPRVGAGESPVVGTYEPPEPSLGTVNEPSGEAPASSVLPDCLTRIRFRTEADPNPNPKTGMEQLLCAARAAWGPQFDQEPARVRELAGIVTSWSGCPGDGSCSDDQALECATLLTEKIATKGGSSLEASRALLRKVREEDTRRV